MSKPVPPISKYMTTTPHTAEGSENDHGGRSVAPVELSNAAIHFAEQERVLFGALDKLFAEHWGTTLAVVTCNGNITTSFHLAISLHNNAAAQLIFYERLMCFCKSELPRQARMLDGTNRRSPGSAIMARYKDNVGFCFGNTGSDRSYSRF